MPQAAQKVSDKSLRRGLIAKVQIQWKELRPDLKHPSDESRDERLSFITQALRLKEPLDSIGELSNRKLGLVLDAFKTLRDQPQLPNSHVDIKRQPHSDALTSVNGGAEIIHLASAEQVFTITKLLEYLGWSTDSQKAFISKRYRRENPRLLRPKQAQSLVRILFNIACARDLKGRGVATVSRTLIREEIPKLKARLGIGRPRTVTEGVS